MNTASLLAPYVLHPREAALSWRARIESRENAYQFAESERVPVFAIYNCYRNVPAVAEHHHRFLEISLMLSGTGTAFIDGRATALRPGTLLFVNHLQSHAEAFERARTEKLILAILPSVIESGIDLSVSNGMFRAFSLTEPFFREKAVNTVTLDAHAAMRIARCWCGLIHAYNTGVSDEAVTAHTRSLLEFIVAEHGRRTAASAENAIAPALYHLRMNVKKPDIRAAIAATGLSTSHFYKLFGREIGMPVGRYIMKMRIARAVTLLRASSLPVSYIASDLGFYDESHLHRAVKRETGMTAASFREKNAVQGEKNRVPGQRKRY